MTGDGVRDVQWAVLDSPNRLVHPLLRRLHSDWQAARTADSMPGHDFVDPVALHYLLGSLLLVDVQHDPAGAKRFQYRLIGTDLVARRGRDSTGLWMDQHADPEVARTGPQACSLAVESRGAVRVTTARVIFKTRYALEYLLLPLAADHGTTIDRLLIAQIYPPEAPRLPYGSGIPQEAG